MVFELSPETDNVVVGATTVKGEPAIGVAYPASVVTCTVYVMAEAEPPVGAVQLMLNPLEVTPEVPRVLGNRRASDAGTC